MAPKKKTVSKSKVIKSPKAPQIVNGMPNVTVRRRKIEEDGKQISLYLKKKKKIGNYGQNARVFKLKISKINIIKNNFIYNGSFSCSTFWLNRE